MHRFSRIVAALALAAAAARAQRLTWYDRLLLLAAPQTVSGVVLDDSGKPVAGAHIDHSDVQPREQLFTDDQGRFQLHTRAPALIIRKLGYNGQLVRIAPGIRLRIVLQRATKALATCAAGCRVLKTPSSSFCFPPIPGVQAGEQGHYQDTFVRAFTAQAGNRTTELLHGAGPNWSLGIPYTGDVWESAQYSEQAFIAAGSDVIDARGTAPDGKRWRYLGRFGESASYYEADPPAAALLDRVLDGVCIAGH